LLCREAAARPLGVSGLRYLPAVQTPFPPDEKLPLTEISAGLEIIRSAAATEQLTVQTARCEHAQPCDGQ